MARRARQFIFILILLIAAGGPWVGSVTGLRATDARADDVLNAAIAQAIGGARAHIDAGQYAEAIRLLRPAIEDEELPPELMAEGFFYRGVARLELDRLVAAMSDFANALWLQALPMTLEAQAHVHRARAYARLGRNPEARDDLMQAMRIAPNDPLVAAATQTSGFAAPESGEQPTGALPKASASVEGGYSVQLGALVDMASARQEWDRLLVSHEDLLAGLAPRYEETPSSSSRLIRLRAGPLATLQASENLCARLRNRGQDCFAVAE